MTGRDPATDEPHAEPVVVDDDRMPVRRRPSDVVRVVIFVVALAVVVTVARIEPDTVAPDLWVIDTVGPGVRRFTGVILVAAALGALGAALALAVVRGRRGAVRDVVAAAVASAAVSV